MDDLISAPERRAHGSGSATDAWRHSGSGGRRDEIARLAGNDGLAAEGFGFDRRVARGGYAWWYVDAVSDDGASALTLIAFIGSVFSPYYAWARRWQGVGHASPDEHCAFNLGLYDLSAERHHENRWSMTERGAKSVVRDATRLQIGPSALRWENGDLIANIDEIAVPIPRSVKGRIRLAPTVDVNAYNHSVAVDRDRQHFWRPIAPTARIEVEFEQPNLHWKGHAYLDCNYGHTPLEAAFRRWQWSRATLADGSTAVVYDVTLPDNSTFNLARKYLSNGAMRNIETTPALALPATFWGIKRDCYSSASAAAPTVAATLENGPFYARSLIETEWLGEPVTAVHESLSLTRFAKPVVQAMLPFRMPRW